MPKISELADGGAVQATDQIPITRAGTTVRGQINTAGFAAASHTHGAAAVTTGTFTIARIPVAASGVSDANLVVRSDDARLSDARNPTAHNHDAAAITSGTLDVARVPIAADNTSSASAVVRANDTRLSNARAPTAHNHLVADITDFNAGARTQIAGALVEGSGVTITPSGSGATQTFEISATGGAAAGVFRGIDLTITADDADATVGTAKRTFVLGAPFTVTEVAATATVAPTGQSAILDVNIGGTSILGTTKVEIPAGAQNSALAPIITSASIAQWGVMTVDIDRVGSTVPGRGFHIIVRGDWGTPTALPPVPNFNPLTDFPGLYAWIDPDDEATITRSGGVFQTIASKLGGFTFGAFGAHALPTTIAGGLNGRQCFDFANSSLTCAPVGLNTAFGGNTNTKDWTFMALVRFDTTPGSGLAQIIGVGSAGAELDTNFLGVTSSGPAWRNTRVDNNSATNLSSTAPNLADTNAHVLVATWVGSTLTASLYIDNPANVYTQVGFNTAAVFRNMMVGSDQRAAAGASPVSPADMRMLDGLWGTQALAGTALTDAMQWGRGRIGLP